MRAALSITIVVSSAAASAGPSAGWRVTSGPSLPYASRPYAMSVLDDGRLMFASDYQPLILDTAARGWRPLDTKGKAGFVGPPVAIPGGVLIADGWVQPGPHRAGIVWDTQRDTWRETGGLAQQRGEQSAMAVALADGSVLVVGGFAIGTQKPIASAEWWSAKRDGFAPAGALRSPRTKATITRLRDGRVLVAGGATVYGRGGVTREVDIYDPARNSWTAASDLSTPRRGHTATLLPDGRVLVAGGHDFDEVGIAELEAWDPKSGRWSIVGKLREPRAYHAALLSGSRVLFIGGITRGDEHEHLANGVTALTVEIWNTATSTWETPFYPPHGYDIPAVAELPDHRIVVAMGYTFTTALKTVELWTPGPVAPPLWELVGTTPVDGRVVLGARSAYRFSTGVWHAMPAAPFFVEDHKERFTSFTGLADGRLLVIGGHLSKLGVAVWDPKATAWSSVAITDPRYRHAAAPLVDGRVLVTGGEGPVSRTSGRRRSMQMPQGVLVRSTEIFDPTTNTFAPSGPLARTRLDAAGVGLADGRALVVGGRLAQFTSILATTEVWSPKTGRFVAGPAMHVPRSNHTATRIPDGRVVVIGGDDQGTLEIYDPARDRWSAPIALPERWDGHRASLLPDGRVLVALDRRTVALAIPPR